MRIHLNEPVIGPLARHAQFLFVRHRSSDGRLVDDVRLCLTAYLRPPQWAASFFLNQRLTYVMAIIAIKTASGIQYWM
jgi:hypothetical protein